MICPVIMAAAMAQEPATTGSVQQLHFALDSQRTVWTDDASVVRSGAAQARAFVSYAAQPLVIDRGGDDLAVVRSAWQTDLSASVTTGRARLGFTVPFLMGVRSDQDDVASAGLSDVGIDAKYTLLDPEVARLGFAAVARVGLPVAGAGVTGFASRTPWLEATAVLDGQVGPVHVLTNLGLRVGASAAVDDVTVGDQFVGRAAVAVPFAADRAGASIEVASRVGVAPPLGGTTPVEAGLTGWFRLTDRVAVRGGVRRFVVDGFGASAGRGFVGITTHPRSRSAPSPVVVDEEPLVDEPLAQGRDRDDDGIPDAVDRCVRKAEDADGYRDGDGCPDDVQLGVRIQTRDGAIAHGAFAWLRCQGERYRLMPDEVIEVPEGSCVLDAAGIGWSAQTARRYVDNGPPVEWQVPLTPTQPMARLELTVVSSDGAPLEEVLWSVGDVYGRVTEGYVAMALPEGRYPVRVKARGTQIDERMVDVGRNGTRVAVALERR